MACARGLCSAQKIFQLINVAFAMYSGALLATAARLAWDPSTYTWFRFLCATQYRVSAGYVLAAGVCLAVLACLAACEPGPRALRLYTFGVAGLAVTEVGYGAWMAASLSVWWRTAPQAELARKGIDLVHDLKPALLAVERYRDVARPLYDIIEEVEREAPNNAFVIGIFGVLGIVLQVGAIVTAHKLSRRHTDGEPAPALGVPSDDDSDTGDASPHRPGWRKDANLRMYTILDKIF